MKVFCRYSVVLDEFLKEVVQYTLCKYGKKLDLSNLKEIELRNIKEFGYETDGQTCDGGTKILLTSRLYEQLPSYDILELDDNEDFKMIVNSLYHEMGHVSDWLQFPNLYALASDMDGDQEKSLPSLFWLEYLAEKRSSAVKGISDMKLCEQFINNKWHAYRCDFKTINDTNFFYLNKALPYFLAKTIDMSDRKRYVERIDNKLLKEYIGELQKEIVYLESQTPFDNVEKLNKLYDIMNVYYKKFQEAFNPKVNDFGTDYYIKMED